MMKITEMTWKYVIIISAILFGTLISNYDASAMPISETSTDSGCIVMEKISTKKLVCVFESSVPTLIERNFLQIIIDSFNDKYCIAKGWPDNPTMRCFDTIEESKSVICDQSDETCVYEYGGYLPPENFGCASNDSMLDLCYVTENRPYCMLYVQNDGKLSQTKICYKNEIELNFFGCNTDNGTCYFQHGRTFFQSADGCAISTNPDECKVFLSHKNFTANDMR